MSNSLRAETVHMTISISNGCVLVHTSQQRPTVGTTLDPVSQLALEIGMLASRAGAQVQYQSNPVLEFLGDIVSPEGFGHAVSAEVTAAASRLLNGISGGGNHGH